MTQQHPFHLMAKPIGPICNIRCEYCFYLSKEELFGGKNRSEFAMREDVLETFVRQYIEAQPPGTPEITFAWQGGEPTLLPQSFFEKAVEFEKKYAPRGMKVSNAFQTNGILVSRSRAEWFAENNFLVGISIDGPEDLHNRYRIDKAGQGTFRDVMAGLENMKAAGVEFNTLTVVQSDNAEHPQRVYDFLKSVGSTFFQFIPIVEPMHGGASGAAASPGVSSRTVSPGQWGRFMNGIFDNWVKQDIGEIFVQHFDMLLGLHAGYPASVCVHGETCGRAMAIEHDGTVYSCDHFVSPEYRQGNIMEEPLVEIVNRPSQVKFGLDKRDTLPDVCRSCPHLKLCWGACPKDRLLDVPGGRLNWLCEGYYALYEHTAPHFKAMADAIRARMPASEFRRFFRIDPKNRPGRNDPCPCLSGRKFKACHGQDPST
ncbi:MAG: anaerobic sulfatase maturase [Spirochaetaceae bacterium]|nr:anaerobic sulfatase maturase [Spirochaetaceae bacterium]